LSQEKKLSLTVDQAYVRDEFRNVARIDLASMVHLEMSKNNPEAIEIMAQDRSEADSTFARCLRLYLSDDGKGIIKRSMLTRLNADKLALGVQVTIRKATTFIPQQIVVVPVERQSPVDPRYLSDALDSHLVKVGDIVAVPYFSQRLTFKVIETIPSASTGTGNVASISQLDTTFLINEKK